MEKYQTYFTFYKAFESKFWENPYLDKDFL